MGPTEATVDVTYYNCTNDKKLVSIPIGKPISNIKIYILTSTKQMTPIGVAGELYISGAGVARGYLNQPEMTAEKFLPDPFNPGERMYRTGDLAKWLPDGNIEYLGRIDNQVKIRGYRIELDEIESRLTRISQIKEAVVTAPKDAMGTRYLCAYVVSDKKLHVAELKVELGQVLPSYMIPTRFIQLEKLPLTTNGKVDRKNLPDPTDIINDETNYMAPRTDIEKQLVKIWSNILKIDKFGINDDFFSLGGHSDLTFTIEEKDSQLTLNIEYATSLFDIEIIESLKNHFIQILYNVTQNSSNKISQINIIENIEEEGEDCINKDFLSSFTEKVFHEIFEQQVSKTPNKIAVVCGEETLTYDELNKKSNQLARKLVSLDVNSDTIVGIIADKSLGMIVGILGVLKAGGAYVPIDPTTPLERITSIIDDCGAEIILTNKNYYHLINNQQKIDLDEESLFKGNSCNLNISVNKDDLVYVIYTSGSTGKPKGVMISHKNYLSIAYSWNNIYKLQEFDVKLLQLASFSFDVFAGDLARTLLFGGQLILCSTDTILDFKLLSQLIVNNKINILESTPKLLIPLLQYIYENKVDVSFMKIIIFGSDVCPMPDFKIIIQRFGGNIRIFNTYGTTETTIDSLFYEGNSIANKECNYVPIGKAFPNTKTYVLNRYLQKQPVGVIGELYIEGEGIARGYLNNINLTEEKFIPNPFNKHSRLYKTGDLVRKLKDGNIEFIGRKDNQVKISGYRIELGEIETFILGYDGIDNVVVNIGSNETGDEFFCAYIKRVNMK
ncbi:D-alanine--D-alanyl carrier protein ligase [Lysinibacillus sphaericus]